MATYAIGDVQGCMNELESLLGACAFDRGRDRLWFVGDLVNRGPASLEVLRFVRGLGESAVAVLGNHDLHLLSVAEGLVKPRGDDTLEAVLGAPDRAELLDWLRARPLLHSAGNDVLVHAGLLPQWSVAQAKSLAGEVEASLRGPAYRDFLAHLYGGLPAAWDNDLQGMDRLRVIVNAMTRMRFCTDAGTMEFHSKGGRRDAPAGYRAWFDVPDRRSAGSNLICGHWSALGLYVQPGLIALDSGCVWGGSLSAVRLEDKRLFQIHCSQSRATGAD